MSNETGHQANANSPSSWLRLYAAVAVLPLALAACGGGGGGSSPPPPPPPAGAASITVTPSATTAAVDGAPVDLTAVVANSSATPTWTLTGAGTLSATTGTTITYTPPDSDVFDESATVTISAAVTGATSTPVSITLSPVVVAGFTWADISATSVGNLQAVDYADGRYVAVSDTGNALTSTDGATWTSTPVFASGTDHFDAMSVTHVGNLFVATGSRSASPYTTTTGAVATSSDGVTWTIASTPAVTTPIHAVAAGPHLVGVGEGRNVFASTDGLSWTLALTFSANSHLPTMNAITYASSKFVVVGDNGLIATSVNGSSWEPSDSVVMGTLRSVAVSSYGEIVIVGDNGIETSKDGVTWYARDEGAAAVLNDVAFLNGRFVAVGASSAIKTSDH